MNDFMKTILNAIQSWTKKEIKNSTSDWNQNDVNHPSYIKNRTHYDSRKVEEIKITFDGDWDNYEHFWADGGAGAGTCLVKVSDLTPTQEELVGGNFVMTTKTPDGKQTENQPIVDDSFDYDGAILLLNGGSVAILPADDEFCTKGIWFTYIDFGVAAGYPSELAFTGTVGELKKIDEKYLPEIDISSKMDKKNPVGTGSFSMNRKAGTVVGIYSFTEGDNNTASGRYSHAEGYATIAASTGTAIQTNTSSDGFYTHAEGYGSVASGAASHAEGNGTKASGFSSHAEGYSTKASYSFSHAEGCNTIASGHSSHAEGNQTSTASNAVAVATNSSAEEYASHAEGYGSVASGAVAHAEGNGTKASGWNSHAEGLGTTAQRKSQHAQGEYNILDTEGTTTTRGKYAHIVGNGSNAARSNAHTLDWSGNAWFAGDVYVGSTSGKNRDEGSKKLATEEYVSTLVGDTNVATQISNAISELNTLPAVTTADNGKVLMVVDGAWKLVSLNLSVNANGVVSVG